MVLSALEMAPTFRVTHVQASVHYVLNVVTSATHMSALPVLSLLIFQARMYVFCAVHLSITVFSAVPLSYARAVPIPTLSCTEPVSQCYVKSPTVFSVRKAIQMFALSAHLDQHSFQVLFVGLLNALPHSSSQMESVNVPHLQCSMKLPAFHVLRLIVSLAVRHKVVFRVQTVTTWPSINPVCLALLIVQPVHLSFAVNALMASVYRIMEHAYLLEEELAQ